MTSYQWIKLHHDMLDDPKVGRLSDGAFRLYINLSLLAGRQEDRDGKLPELADIAWALRLDEEVVTKNWGELEKVGLVYRNDEEQGVSGFKTTQDATNSTDRSRQHRSRTNKKGSDESPAQQSGNGDATACNDDATIRCTDIDIDKDNTPLNPPVGGNGGAEPAFLRPGIVDSPIALGSGRKNGHVNGFARRPPERIGVLIEAIRQVVKTTYDKDAIQDFEDAAYEVEGWGGTSESVAGFLPWWEQSEKYAGLPALKSFRAEYRNYLRGVKPSQVDANGLAAAPRKLIIAADDEAGGYYG